MSTPTQITINLNDDNQRALIAKTSGHALSAENIASTLLHSFAHHAPPAVVRWIADQRGQISEKANLWGDYAASVRREQLHELKDELALIELIRKVASPQPRQ